MKLSLKVLKDYLLGIEVMCNEEGEDNYSEWINNNISDIFEWHCVDIAE